MVPAAWHRVLARRPSNFACNSPLAISNFEFISLELQRFWTLLKVHAIELHANFAECWPRRRPPAPRPGRACGIKFSLLGLLVARSVQSSPCWRQMPQNRRFSVCWESFVPGEPTGAACWESFVPDVVSYAVQSSPCSGCWWLERYKILPADAKRIEKGHFGCVGRVLYRFDPRGLRTGRVLYRVGRRTRCVRRLLRWRWWRRQHLTARSARHRGLSLCSEVLMRPTRRWCAAAVRGFGGSDGRAGSSRCH